MKFIGTILLGIFLWCKPAYAQLPAPHVDERFELTSIAFRLAGMPEFSRCGIPAYADAIDSYFKPFANGELTKFIVELRKNYGVAYDAVSSTAALLEIKNGHVILQSQYDIANISEVDPRWQEETFSKYLELLDRFYRKSNFRKFFNSHKELYAVAEERLNEWVGEIETGWFESFYGKPLDPNVKIYVSLTNGPSNYAFDKGILIGSGGHDSGGQPVFDIYTLYTMLHELCHHYTNPVFDLHWPDMESAADRIYPFVAEKMIPSAYGMPSVTFLEWLNNLCVLMYYKEHHADDGSLPVWARKNVEKGFIWMLRSVEFMDNFYSNRALYPHMADFMPQLSLFVNFVADNMELVQREFENRQPYVTNVFPAVGSDISQTKEIRVRFSEPMRTDCKGVHVVSDERVKYIPGDPQSSYWEDDRTFVMLVPIDQLEPDQLYGVSLPSMAFLSEKDFKMGENVDLIFNTGQE